MCFLQIVIISELQNTVCLSSLFQVRSGHCWPCEDQDIAGRVKVVNASFISAQPICVAISTTLKPRCSYPTHPWDTVQWHTFICSIYCVWSRVNRAFQSPRSVGGGSWHHGCLCKDNPPFPRWSVQVSMEQWGLKAGRGGGGQIDRNAGRKRETPLVQEAMSSGFLSLRPTPLAFPQSDWLCDVSFLPAFFSSLHSRLSVCMSVCQPSVPSVWFVHDNNLFFWAKQTRSRIYSLHVAGVWTFFSCWVKHLRDGGGRANSSSMVDDMFLT